MTGERQVCTVCVMDAFHPAITFDENGFSADQAVYFRYDEPDAGLFWTLHLHGLSGNTAVIRNREGQMIPMETVTEGSFNSP